MWKHRVRNMCGRRAGLGCDTTATKRSNPSSEIQFALNTYQEISRRLIESIIVEVKFRKSSSANDKTVNISIEVSSLPDNMILSSRRMTQFVVKGNF